MKLKSLSVFVLFSMASFAFGQTSGRPIGSAPRSAMGGPIQPIPVVKFQAVCDFEEIAYADRMGAKIVAGVKSRKGTVDLDTSYTFMLNGGKKLRGIEYPSVVFTVEVAGQKQINQIHVRDEATQVSASTFCSRSATDYCILTLNQGYRGSSLRCILK